MSLTYKELLKQLSKLNEEQLNKNVAIHDLRENEYIFDGIVYKPSRFNIQTFIRFN
jgi:hypothetical protein